MFGLFWSLQTISTSLWPLTPPALLISLTAICAPAGMLGIENAGELTGPIVINLIGAPLEPEGLALALDVELVLEEPALVLEVEELELLLPHAATLERTDNGDSEYDKTMIHGLSPPLTNDLAVTKTALSFDGRQAKANIIASRGNVKRSEVSCRLPVSEPDATRIPERPLRTLRAGPR